MHVGYSSAVTRDAKVSAQYIKGDVFGLVLSPAWPDGSGSSMYTLLTCY
jgi:hypothetical protein